MTRTVRFHNLKRVSIAGETELLELTDGVNLLVGSPNTGKTKWLSILDFLLGDTDTPEKEFGPELAKKYKEASVELVIADESWELRRNWMEAGKRGKLFLNGQALDAEDFSTFIFEQLDWPLLRYPQGNPYNPRLWKTLGWRSLFRHIYRQQDYWGDLVDKQFPAEQHACVLYFLGIAQKLFTTQTSSIIDKDKQRLILTDEKERFVSILTDISQQLLDQELVEITWDSLNKAISEQQSREEELKEERNRHLQQLLASSGQDSTSIESLEDRWTAINSKIKSLIEEQARLESKIQDSKQFKDLLKAEQGRLNRAISAGDVLADYRVTTCPACDQSVAERHLDSKTCHVCMQPLAPEKVESLAFLEAELYHAESNLEEVDSLVEKLTSSQGSAKRSLLTAKEESERVDAERMLYRDRLNTFTSPQLSALDMELGRAQERIRQLQRIAHTLNRRDEISKQIDTLNNEIAILEAVVKAGTVGLDFEQAADDLSEGMNTYLNELTKREPDIWQQDEVRVRLSESAFEIFIGSVSAKQKLGGSNKLRLWMAYHYALLRLTLKGNRYYPGLVIIDFPPRLEDGSLIADKENFVIEPFIDLVNSSEVPMQVIAAGSAFDKDETNRLILTHIWN